MITKNAFRALVCCLLLQTYHDGGTVIRATEAPDRVITFPRFVVGQAVTYDIGYRAASTTNTESNVAAPMAPTSGQIEAHLILQVQAVEIGADTTKPFVHLRTQIFDGTAGEPANAAPASGASSNDSGAAKIVEFTLHGNGQITDLTGLETLSSAEKAAWQDWVARFGMGAAIPEKGVRPGEKWRTEEPITTALLTGLSWDKESQYVDDEPCGAPAGAQAKNISALTVDAEEPCAVILTTAILKQKNPQKDSTPDDYKLRDLRTYGVAKGKNEVISYVSLKSGIVVRVMEDVNQSLNVIVAKADGSNRVHYIIDAQSHSQMRLTAAPSAASHP